MCEGVECAVRGPGRRGPGRGRGSRGGKAGGRGRAGKRGQAPGRVALEDLLAQATDTKVNVFYPSEIVKERYVRDQRQYDLTWHNSVTSKHKSTHKSRIARIVKETTDGKHALVQWNSTFECARGVDGDATQVALVTEWKQYCSDNHVATPLSPPGSADEQESDGEGDAAGDADDAEGEEEEEGEEKEQAGEDGEGEEQAEEADEEDESNEEEDESEEDESEEDGSDAEFSADASQLLGQMLTSAVLFCLTWNDFSARCTTHTAHWHTPGLLFLLITPFRLCIRHSGHRV